MTHHLNFSSSLTCRSHEKPSREWKKCKFRMLKIEFNNNQILFFTRFHTIAFWGSQNYRVIKIRNLLIIVFKFALWQNQNSVFLIYRLTSFIPHNFDNSMGPTISNVLKGKKRNLKIKKKDERLKQNTFRFTTIIKRKTTAKIFVFFFLSFFHFFFICHHTRSIFAFIAW